jgi:hypothetical protein
MADKKISALTASTTPLAGTEVLPIVQGGSTVKVSVANLTAGRAVSASSLTASTDNIIIGTTAKGVTTGSAIPLGLGVNNAVNAVTIDTSNRVGLGTPTPLSTLDVNGGVSVGRTNAGQPIVLFNGDAVNAQQLDIRMSGTNAVLNATRAGGTPPDIIFQCDNSERMRLSTGGNLTITSNNLVIGTADKGITTGSAIPLGFGVNNTVTAMTIDTSSNVGVGTTSPSTGAMTNTAVLNAGVFATLRGAIASTSGAAVTIAAANQNYINAIYIVSVGLNGGDPAVYSAVAIVTAANNVLRATPLQTAALMTISVSGTDIQATQNSGVGQTIYYTLTRIS